MKIRPDLARHLLFLQNDINKATIATLMQTNQILYEAKRYQNTHIRIQPIPMDKIRFLAFSDTSFASKKHPESHAGMIIMIIHANISKNHVCAVNPISWGCKKIQCVVTSTFSAETTSLGSTLDQLSWLRLCWAWINNPIINWKKIIDAQTTSTNICYNNHQRWSWHCNYWLQIIVRFCNQNSTPKLSRISHTTTSKSH